MTEKKIVVIGGGNGTSTVLSALKATEAELTAIVSMADDGGSTGRLRQEKGVSAVGDIRQCLTALTKNQTSKNLFSYRFTNGELEGHSFGNIFLASIEERFKSIKKAIQTAKNVLEVEENILPITEDKPNLRIKLGSEEIDGVFNAAQKKIDFKKAEISLTPDAFIDSEAEEAIQKADLIIIAPGNFYCSVIPALIVEGVAEALKNAKSKKIMISNLVNFKNHTDNYKLSNYIAEFERIVGEGVLDVVVSNTKTSYESKEQFVVNDISESDHYEIIQEELLSREKIQADPNDKIADVRSSVRHEKSKLNKIITQYLRS